VDIAKHHQPHGETFSMPILALKFSSGSNGVSELPDKFRRDVEVPLA